jgi:hypothetical protein
MAIKNFSKQTPEQLISHLKSYLGDEDCDLFNLKIDTFANIAEVKKAKPGKKGASRKKEKIKEEMKEASSSRRKKMLSAKRREKPKLKHVRNGRMISLRGYSGY